MCSSWVFCCASWLDIPAGCPAVLSGPMMGAHNTQPHCVRSRVPPIRFDAISQFATSVLYSRTSLIPSLPIASFCWLQIWFLPHCHMRHCMGRVWQCSACAKLPLIFFSLPSSSRLRACFESTVGVFSNNLLLLDIWSELSTFWHEFAVVHDGERIVPASGKS